MHFQIRNPGHGIAKPNWLGDAMMNRHLALRRRRGSAGFTLIEVAISALIVAMVFGGIIMAYEQSGQRVEWTGYSLAAQALAMQTIEQARATVWDPAQTPPVNELTNLNLMGATFVSGPPNYILTGFTTNILDVPYQSTNYVMATNYVTISIVSLNGNSNDQEQVVQVQTVWPFWIRASNLYFTNTVTTIISPDNRAPQTF
jgi:Tfp pilus assembly protein PilV